MKILDKINEINEHICESSNIFLMAHKDLDLDAICSCIGMDYYLKRLCKDTYIIINDTENEPGVKKVIDQEKDKINIIKGKKVKEYINDNSLLIILDTSKEKLVQDVDCISLFKNIINIDHHDKNKDTLKSTLKIIDEDTSSASEMIAYLLKENNIKIPNNIATLLLSGITLDTNNYKTKTNADTFYISYYLTKCGAKINDVNYLLKQNIKDYINRQKMITSVKVIKGMAIGRGTSRVVYKKEELAKTADSLLTFNKIKASFVVAKLNKEIVGISARSTGEINVGKIMEQFGGGGDENEAAAKIETGNLNKVIEDLTKLIKNI